MVALVDTYQGYLFAGSTIVAAGIGLLMAGGFTTAIHIARDLIDHQYRPELGYSYYLLPKAWRDPGRPRRSRISQRLDTLAREVICKTPFDNLVFVVHSQGSVIVYDYLLAGGVQCGHLLRVRPHLVTFGSPLGHLYEFYFREYDGLEKHIGALSTQLSSWTNVYRVDDYVGRSIGKGDGGFVRNVVLPAGGHTDYWRELDLAKVIAALIGRAPATPARATSEPQSI